MKWEISTLMEHYTDDEFSPPEGAFVDPKAVAYRVMAQAAPQRPKWRPSVRIIAVAAVLAACMTLTAVGWFYRNYRLNAGYDVTFGENTVTYTPNEKGGVISEEDGRLYFIADGQHIDITDEVDEDTPYFYTMTDENHTTYDFVVGGVPGNYGWIERMVTEDGREASTSKNTAGPWDVILDGQRYSYDELTEEQLQQVEELRRGEEGLLETADSRAWVVRAQEVLGWP